tara:strand:- start:132 stop:479 length:348 start_codon:yes stop_codon:yes gene_type:complete
MITPLSNVVHTDNNSYLQNKVPMSDNIANNMPNGLLRISEIQNNKNINNQIHHKMMKNIFTHQLAPSSTLTESFIKAKSLVAPIFRNNEAIAKYESISMAPLKLAQVKKDLNRII